ncbi:MAG: methionyl-tRNA formyltransferase, partial [Bacteroidaceae bacterium]|nr:methionyl-tRNA formyltransferase [Bacteroidaceae bacterium]
MNKQDFRIVYMGTPDFAVEGLKALVEGGYNIVGVVTMPDKPMGRHQDTLQPSPVKVYAQEHGLKIMQPVKLKDPEFVEELLSLHADLQIVVAFRMLPEIVWSMPKYGTFNAHASLLPKYRGAAPINWAVINGETETGITTFLLKHEIDTGDIIDQVRIPIADTDNVEIVHDKLMELSGKLVTKTVDSIIDGTFTTTPQDEWLKDGAKEDSFAPAPKIFRETCRIDWNQPTKKVYDFVRGLSPYPAAWTMLNGKAVKIFETEKEFTAHNLQIGTIISDGKS